MKNYQSFLLISADSVKRIGAAEVLENLLISSSISRVAQRYSDLKLRTREKMTSLIGIHSLSGSIHIRVHPLHGDRWLLVITVCQDSNAGTPSPLSLYFSPAFSMTHGLGIYKDTVPNDYRNHTQSLYMSKTGLGYPARLALPGANRPQTYVRSQ